MAIVEGQQALTGEACCSSLKNEIQTAFQYFLIPSYIGDGDTDNLSSSCDGTVLVLTANRTHREAALRAKECLERCPAPLLVGTVLDNRGFPIPEAIYRRL